MEPLSWVLLMAAVFGGWWYLVYRQSHGRIWNSLWLAFSATAAGLLFAVAGVAGYTLNKHDRFVAHTSWAGHVIWSQVGMGVLAGCVAAFFWRRALNGRRHV